MLSTVKLTLPLLGSMARRRGSGRGLGPTSLTWVLADLLCPCFSATVLLLTTNRGENRIAEGIFRMLKDDF